MLRFAMGLSVARWRVAGTAARRRYPLFTTPGARRELHSFALRLRQVDPLLAEFRWPLGEPVPALGAFFGRRRRIDYLLDCLRGELLRAQLPAWPADRPRWRLDLQPKLDQPADSFRATKIRFVLSPYPGVQGREGVIQHPNAHDSSGTRRNRTPPLICVNAN